jgi:RWP-RK domain
MCIILLAHSKNTGLKHCNEKYPLSSAKTPRSSARQPQPPSSIMRGTNGMQTLKAAANNGVLLLACNKSAGKKHTSHGVIITPGCKADKSAGKKHTSHGVIITPRCKADKSAGKKHTSHGVIITPGCKAGENYLPAKPFKVTRQMLEDLTHLPIPNACKKLGICPTTFKKACRREGIMEWPYKRGCARGGRANNVMHTIMIPESSFASSSYSEDGKLTILTVLTNTTSADEPTNTEEDADACAAHNVDFLEQGFFDNNPSFLLLPYPQDPYLQDVAMFYEEDSAFLRMTGWDTGDSR